MPHVAILVFPDHGSVNPALEIGRALLRLGHRVTCVVDGNHADRVTAAGARAVPYRSALVRPGGGAVTGDDPAELGLAALRESIDVVLPLVLDTFRDDVPDLVLYDFPSFFPARVAARRWGRPAAQLFTGLAGNEQYSPAVEQLEGAAGDAQRYIDLVAAHLDGAGEDPGAVWSLLTGFDERNIVLLPRAFQPLGETFDDRYVFAGHGLGDAEPETGMWSQPPGAARSVWIVLGTGADDRPGLLETCRAAFGGGDWRPVMAVGPGQVPAGGPAEIVEWTRFRSFLPFASAVVCHSGVSTLVEAIYFGRPVVLVTYTPEDRLHGRRLTELGLGLALPAARLTAEGLRAAADRVAADPEIRRRVGELRAEMLAAGGPQRAARAIDGWLSQETPAVAPAVAAKTSHSIQRR
jgi:MGT family glycosyltransferase